jgi:hypothetical protein
MTDKEEADASKDEGSAIVDGRKKKNYAWPDGVYDAIIELKEKDPKRPINDDFLKSVNKRCKSGINVNGVNSWWCRHQRKLKVEKAGTSASPGVQKEKLKRKAAQPASSEDGEDSDEKEGANNGDRDDDRQPQVNRMVSRKERLQSELVVEHKLTAAKLENALADVVQLKNELKNVKAASEATVRLKPRGDPHLSKYD